MAKNKHPVNSKTISKILLILAFLFLTDKNIVSAQAISLVQGKIVDENEQPLADILLQFVGKEVYRTRSTQSGSFSIDIPFGSYELKVDTNGYQYFKQNLVVEDAKPLVLAPIILHAVRLQELSQVDIVWMTDAKEAKERPFNVNVLEASRFFNTSQDLNQLLTRTTGIRVREDGGVGSDFRFSMNGFSGRSVKFFLDGMPMDNFGSSLSLNNFPATMVERIEVYKGVVPMTLGADALGGAVNVITRSNPNYLDLSYGFGSFNTHKAGLNGAYTNERTGLSVRFNGFYNYSDNNYKVEVSPIRDGMYLPIQEVERFHDGYWSIGGHVEAGVRNKPYADQLFIGLLSSKNDKDIQTGVTMDQVFGARTRNSSSVIPTIKYNKTNLFAEGLDFNLYGAYNMTNNHFIDTTGLIYNWLQETRPNVIEAEQSRTQLKNKDQEALLTSNLSYRINGFHKLALNYVLTDFSRESSDVEDPQNVTHTLPKGLRKQNIGLGLESAYGKLRVHTFAKYYALKAESFENFSSNNVPDYRPTTVSKDYMGYGLASSYFFTPRLQAKASYEHAYRLPDPEELLGDGLFTARNSALRPEKSDNFNLGGLYAFDLAKEHHFQTELGLLYRRSEDFIRLEQARNQPTNRRYINVGNVDTKGIEAEIQYNWRGILSATVNGSYQNIIDRTEFIYTSNLSGSTVSPNLNYGYKIPNTPYLFGNADVGVRLKPAFDSDGFINLHYSINYVAKYYLTPQQIGLNNNDVIPEQVAHNIMANYSFDKGKYNLSFECRNLTDSQLFDNYRLQKPGRSFSLKLRYFIQK